MTENFNIILFTNESKIHDTGAEHWDLLFQKNEKRMNNTNWILFFDNQIWKFVEYINNINYSTIYVIYDGGHDEEPFILNDEKRKVLNKLNQISDKVLLVFHSHPSCEIKDEVRALFKNKFVEPAVKPIHSIPEDPQYKNISDLYLFYKVYHSLFELYYNPDGTKKEDHHTFYDGKEVITVNEIIDIIFKNVDENNILNEKLEYLHSLISPKGISGREDKLKSDIEKYNLKLYNITDLQKAKFNSKYYMQFLTELRDVILD